MPRAARTCIDCPAIIRTGRRCLTCQRQREHAAHATLEARAADRARKADGDPYSTAGHRAFRRAVLARDPICTLCHTAWATTADHHPISRRDLITAGLDPNDAQRGRGLCKRCHDRETARLQPGGWHAQRRRVGGNP